jgi:hypothetical protein
VEVVGVIGSEIFALGMSLRVQMTMVVQLADSEERNAMKARKDRRV